MDKQKGSSFWRMSAILALGVASVPLFWRQSTPPVEPLAVPPGESWEVPGEVVVDLKDNASPADITSFAQKYSLSFAEDDSSVNPSHIMTFNCPAAMEDALIAKLRTDPMVEAVEPQRLFRIPEGSFVEAPSLSSDKSDTPNIGGWKPDDPRYKDQWNFRRINMEKAWQTTKGKGVVVAVIDTGVAFDYGDGSHLCKDFKNTGFVMPYDFIHRNKQPHDDNGHGTHVAGTIAESTNNGEGVAGIAFEAKIMPLKVLTKDGFGRMSDIAAAIRYAADNNANIINMSLGGPFPDAVTQNAVKYAHGKGVVIVCAAGNSGGRGVGYPAAYPECIAVSALGPKGTLAPYSSWGEQVAISAPGGDKSQGEDAGILQNTYIRPREGGDEQVDDYYSFQGTSMASPHVAGVAALIVSQGVKDPNEVRAILQKTAQPRGDKLKYGAGELDAAGASLQATGEGSGYYSRLWIVGLLWGGCLLIGLVRGKKGAGAPVIPTLALTVGLFLPDVFTAFVGFSSIWNLLGHSVLVPGFLLLAEADNDKEKRFYGLMAAGMLVHLGWDLWQGSAPFFGSVSWAALPWMWTNILVGFGVLIASRRKA